MHLKVFNSVLANNIITKAVIVAKRNFHTERMTDDTLACFNNSSMNISEHNFPSIWNGAQAILTSNTICCVRETGNDINSLSTKNSSETDNILTYVPG